MKSKKKLVYKLHQNINQNPYKKIQPISFRTSGIHPYDFNKLKSIRAISLRQLNQAGKLQSDKNNKINQSRRIVGMKLNSFDDRDEVMLRQKLALHNKQKLGEQDLIYDVKEKRFSNRTLIGSNLQDYCINGYQTIRHAQQQRNTKEQVLAPQQEKSYPMQIHTNQHYNESTSHHQETSPRQQSQHRHQRNISLPVINYRQQLQPINKALLTSRKTIQKHSTQEQQAKQQIMKQLNINHPQQQKINKQVLMSIKLKSIDNLQRLARSQSQVIKIDKWKEKYGTLGQAGKDKNNVEDVQKMKEKEKALAVKQTVQKLQKQNEQRDREVNQNEFLMYKRQTQNEMYQNKIKISQHQLTNDYYDNTTMDLTRSIQQNQPSYQEISQKIYIKPSYSSMQINPSQTSQKKHIFCLNHYLARQTLTKQNTTKSVSINAQFFNSQPLKITVTQVKKHQRNNKQNLNLLKQKQALQTNIQPIKNQNQCQNKSKSKRKKKTDILQTNTSPLKQKSQTITLNNPINQQQKQTNSIEQSNSKLKSFLQFRQTKYQTERKDKTQTYQPSISQKSKPKPKKLQKFKINEQNAFTSKIAQSDSMIQWENKRYLDHDELQFHTFVKSRAYEMNEIKRQQ